MGRSGSAKKYKSDENLSQIDLGIEVLCTDELRVRVLIDNIAESEGLVFNRTEVRLVQTPHVAAAGGCQIRVKSGSAGMEGILLRVMS